MFDTSANIPKREIDRRIHRVQEAMVDAGLDGALILQNTDLYYFCGTAQQALCYIPVQGDPILMAKKNVQRARFESPIRQVTPIRSPGQLLEILNASGYSKPRHLGMELDVLPANLYLRYRGMLKNVVIHDFSDTIRRLRAVKSSYEIAAIRRAANLADHTRIFSIGRLPEQLRSAHSAMLELQSLLARHARPGVKTGDLYDLAIEFVEGKGYGDVFMGADAQRVRFVGHGIGLELDEYPFLAAGQTFELEENMVIALEPKLVFPGRGVVGIENTHLVTPEGLEKLTCHRDEIIEI